MTSEMLNLLGCSKSNFKKLINKMNYKIIENLLSLNQNIKQSFVYGDKKTYLVALIVTDSEENKKEIQLYIENLNKNLSNIEKIKKFKLIKEEFTIENGKLTPTLKIKRKNILKKYKIDLEKLY